MRKTFGKALILLVICCSVFCGFTLDALSINNKNIVNGTGYSIDNSYPSFYTDIGDNFNQSNSFKNWFLDFFKLRKYKKTTLSDNEVFLGGQPLGVSIGTKGVIIAGISDVITDSGVERPSKHTNIKAGDILISINGNTIFEPSDISKEILKSKDNKAVLQLKRGEDVFNETILMAVDSLSGEYKLGLMVKDNITGIGTLTFIKPNQRFGALGHHIIDVETGLSNELSIGQVYNCNIIGVIKGTKGKAGELKGAFNKYDKDIGTIDINNKFGIFGTMNESCVTNGMKKIKVGNQKSIRTGKAYIYTTIEGNAPEYYEINIIKTISQNKPEEKSMVISVTDKRLLEKTGGIVQGMSGSPIIQDNRLIGAVTHVFINDPTKGYGVYINWMLENN